MSVVKATSHPPGFTRRRASSVACSMLSTARRVTTSNSRAYPRFPASLLPAPPILPWTARACGLPLAGTRLSFPGIPPALRAVSGSNIGWEALETRPRSRSPAGCCSFPTVLRSRSRRTGFPQSAPDMICLGSRIAVRFVRAFHLTSRSRYAESWPYRFRREPWQTGTYGCEQLDDSRF